MVLAVDRHRLPQPDDLDHALIEGEPGSDIRAYPRSDG